MSVNKKTGNYHIKKKRNGSDVPFLDQHPQVVTNEFNVLQLAKDLYSSPNLDGDGLANLGTPLETTVSGKATGPASATDNALARFDLTTGKLLQNSAIICDDSGNLSGINNITISGVGPHSVTEEFANEIIDQYSRTSGTSVSERGVAVSNTINTNTTSTSFVDITNATITITATGKRPVMFFLAPASTSLNSGSVLVTKDNATSTNTLLGNIKLVRDATDVANTYISHNYVTDTNIEHSITLPAGTVKFTDFPTAGTYVYKLQGAVNATYTRLQFVNCKLVAYEL